MNSMTSTAGFSDICDGHNGIPKSSISNDETFWGYIIRDSSHQKSLSIIIRSLAKFAAGAMLLAVAGLWILPGAENSVAVLPFKLGLSVLISFIAIMLFWFSSHDKKYEVQVDLGKLELREALRGKKGNVRVFSKILFEHIEAVYIERASISSRKSRLMLRLVKSGQVIEIARDYEAFLPPVRERLGRDILGQNKMVQHKAPRGSQMLAAQGVNKPVMAAE